MLLQSPLLASIVGIGIDNYLFEDAIK